MPGAIGEVGWPSYEEMVATGLPAAEAADEAEHWNTLAGKWFERADAAKLTVSYCTASGTRQNYLRRLASGAARSQRRIRPCGRKR